MENATENTIKTPEQILAHYRKISILGSARELVSWDMETFMPPASVGLKADQLGILSEIHHREMTRPDFVEAALSVQSRARPEVEQKQLDRLREEILITQAHSAEFVSRRETARVHCQQTWHEAKAKKNFSLVRKPLAGLIDIQREWAAALKESSGLRYKYANASLYEIHMDQYEPGQPAGEVRRVLGELGQGLKQMLPEVLERQGPAKKRAAKRAGPFKMKLEAQRMLCESTAGRLGFDFKRGRMDKSAHPFCGGSPRDVRLTVRYDEDDFTGALYSLIHETGHALYEQGLPEALLDTPCGKAVSLGFHESQSRFFENQLGRSAEFCEFVAKEAGVSASRLRTHLQRVDKSFIRTESDEVTYNLHILLRMRIEEDLIEGRLKVADLPERWNADFKELFGVRVPHDGVGCLQDIHWYGGAFGYFPTYALGNLIAAELFVLYRQAHPRWKQQARAGNFTAVREFLNQKVHSLAALDDSPASLKKVIGRAIPDPQVFLGYLADRYLAN